MKNTHRNTAIILFVFAGVFVVGFCYFLLVRDGNSSVVDSDLADVRDYCKVMSEEVCLADNLCVARYTETDCSDTQSCGFKQYSGCIPSGFTVAEVNYLTEECSKYDGEIIESDGMLHCSCLLDKSSGMPEVSFCMEEMIQSIKQQ